MTVLAALALLAAASVARASEPTASPGGGDVRTTPGAPGLVGDPLFAILGVTLIAALSIAATLIAVRLGGRR